MKSTCCTILAPHFELVLFCRRLIYQKNIRPVGAIHKTTNSARVLYVMAGMHDSALSDVADGSAATSPCGWLTHGHPCLFIVPPFAAPFSLDAAAAAAATPMGHPFRD